MTVSDGSPIPVVDLAPFRDGGDADRRAVAAQVDDACRTLGFLQVTGHGIPGDVCDGLLDAWAAFFDLPMADKRRWVVADESANRGYSWPGKEALAYSRGEETPADLMEAFNVGRRDDGGPYFVPHRAFFAPPLWPDRPPGLRAAWESYDRAAAAVADMGQIALEPIRVVRQEILGATEASTMLLRIDDTIASKKAPAPAPPKPANREAMA